MKLFNRTKIKPKEKQIKKPVENKEVVKQRRKFQYAKPTQKRTIEDLQLFEAEEIKDEKVVSRRVKIETVNDILDLTFLEKLNLVHYYRQLESGKIYEKEVQEEYRRNYESLSKENSLKWFLLEVAKRNLEIGEYPIIIVQIDSIFRKELIKCIESPILSSYQIDVVEQHEILNEMEVQPIIISMRVKEV